jgi:hypothetical protein
MPSSIPLRRSNRKPRRDIPAGLLLLVCLIFFDLTNQVDTPCDNKGKLLRPVFQGFRADPLSDTIVIVNPNVGDIQKNKYNSDKNQIFIVSVS